MALDDWMAILFLLRNPEAEVRAITVAATGEAHARPGARNALRLLALAEYAPIPIVAGSPRPLRGEHAFPALVRLMMDRHLFLKMPPPRGAVSQEDAVSLIIKTLEESEEPVTVVALGPLTNLAQVFLQRPELTAKVTGITMMGGALDVPGNIESINARITNPYAEWNIYIDPYAANVVFSSGVAVTLVPLDATNQVPLSKPYLEQMMGMAGIPALDFVCRALRFIGRLSKGKRTFYFWDPLAAVVTLHPQIAVFEERHVRVVEEEGSESGRVVQAEDGALIRVCIHVDRKAFEKLYLEGMAGIG
jgi:pyrimidine-specific ribonucleoside hydrolase